VVHAGGDVEGARYEVLHLIGLEEVAVARVAARQAVGTDASDASVDIVRAQLAAREPIQPDECTRTSSGESLESLITITGADLDDAGFV